MRVAVLADIHGNLPALRAVLPYEGRPGAFWLMMADGSPELRETRYDIETAIRELRASGFPDVDSLLAEALLEPIDPDRVTRFFEHSAGRGSAPES